MISFQTISYLFIAVIIIVYACLIIDYYNIFSKSNWDLSVFMRVNQLLLLEMKSGKFPSDDGFNVIEKIILFVTIAQATGCLAGFIFELQNNYLLALGIALLILYILTTRKKLLHILDTNNSSNFSRRQTGNDERRYEEQPKPKADKPEDSGARWTTGDGEADYANALAEAQKWADETTDKTHAIGRIKLFERKIKADTHPKDVLRYKLAIALLKEKIKSLN